MEKFYWFCECSNCHQGRLIITEDITNNRLYLHCEECEYGWLNPLDTDDIEKGFLTLLEEFETRNPSIEDIGQYNWLDYAKNSFVE
ncbi:hypothetical protein RND59_13360 [Vibrio ruber]|uniref:Uncharacterized protein n=1 Tax=Vibrio gazogenes TaxID=687 RepID=A0A1Z2SBM7_VIBGA|nr:MULTISPECIES: hypothetical protein [Vibrio]ASA54582.1 hypothetical protein BSQ33_01760 [Vibrio gazogenes]WNJ95106.1 hypothetical protein RND59_13360 [Vibrio ruber]